MLAAVVSGFVLLFLSILMPNTLSPIARVVPPLVLLPTILLMTSCVLWLQSYFLPMLSPQRNIRRRMAEPAYNAVGEEMRTLRRNAVRGAGGYNRIPPREITGLQKACLLGASFLLACVVWAFIVSLLLQPRMENYIWDKDKEKARENERARDRITSPNRELSPGPGLPQIPLALAKAQMSLWIEPATRNAQISRMRQSNPEWEFTSRTFLVLALANVALRDTLLKPAALSVIDTIITETLDQERRHGQEVFFAVSQKGRRSDFLNSSRRSVFIDGQIAMMLGARRLVEENATWGEEMQQRTRLIVQEMREGPLLCGETYPNECRLVDCALAMATLRISNALDGTDYSGFINLWVGKARTTLVDKKANMLVSRFDFTGRPVVLEGPEGVSIWTTAHFLSVVDQGFAQEQYDNAARQLRTNFLAFGYSRARPSASDYARSPQQQQLEVEMDGLVPFLQASPGSSGRALVAAQTFGDTRWMRQLITSLEFLGFRTARERMHYISSNTTGDAVILYALVQGPLWEKLKATVRPPATPPKPPVPPEHHPLAPPALPPTESPAPAPAAAASSASPLPLPASTTPPATTTSTAEPAATFAPTP